MKEEPLLTNQEIISDLNHKGRLFINHMYKDFGLKTPPKLIPINLMCGVKYQGGIFIWGWDKRDYEVEEILKSQESAELPGIFLSRSLRNTRKFLTLLHELGHYLLWVRNPDYEYNVHLSEFIADISAIKFCDEFGLMKLYENEKKYENLLEINLYKERSDLIKLLLHLK
jgi:hypothetical protein